MKSQKHTNIYGSRLFALLVASMVSVALNASGQTKLVLNIVVDGLRLENLDELSKHLSDKGFNRLILNGVTIENADFGTNLDAVASTAMIVTGAAPSVNGIPSATIYNPTSLRLSNIFDDGKTVGNFTNETYSPARMNVTTIADEIRIAGAGVSYSHAIAPSAMQALVLGGHTANSAIWLNDKSANWASTTFYKEFPMPASNANHVRPLSTRLDTMTWCPSQLSARAALLPPHLTQYPFRYTFSRSNPDRLYNFISSPLVNSEISSLACDYITSLALGTHEATDILSLAYNLKPYPASKSAESRYEQIDSYVKLDADLARLFDVIDRNVGLGNTLVVLSATPPPTTRRVDAQRWNIPSGQFSTRKALSLLNMFLMAKYGNGQWVTAFHNSQFFLNADLADKNSVDISTMRGQAAAFLARMSGVQRVTTIDDLISGANDNERSDALRRNTDVRLAGDLFIDILPGWELVDDFNIPSLKRANPTVKALTTAPVFIMGPGIKPIRIADVVDARSIAPTVARILRIRSPNGSDSSPLDITH